MIAIKSAQSLGVDYVIRPHKFQHKDIFVYPTRKDGGMLYERFRNTWFLRRRLKPYVPCPENTPMPNGKMISEQRSTIFSVYLRAWTLVEGEASVEVPFIADLTLTADEWKRGPRFCERQSEHSELHTLRSAWSDYLRRVPPVSFRQTRNFI